jgi:MoxR-like ATPase
MNLTDVATWTATVKDAVGRVILGKDDVIEKLLVALLCRGHVLLEDAPGVGKTILARALSRTLGGEFRRIQCTPDLLPADIVGVSVYNQQSGEFEFREGPVMTNVLLVDEINRATPRSQAGLLEAMTEGSVTVEGRILTLPDPHFVIATENPVEFEGTFPLPEAQRDRFFLCTGMGYPTEEAELAIMNAQRRLTHPVSDLEPVCDLSAVVDLQRLVTSVVVPDEVSAWILELVESTRRDGRLQLGASPRASMALYHGGQAVAAMRGCEQVSRDDILTIADMVLLKRISVKSEYRLRGVEEERVIRELIESSRSTTTTS